MATMRLIVCMAMALLVSVATVPPVQAGESTLVINMYGGEYERQWRKNIVAPFETTSGARVLIDTGTSVVTLGKLRAQKGNPQFDAVHMDEFAVLQAFQEELLEPLNLATIPRSRELLTGAIGPENSWLGFQTAFLVVAYNTDRVKVPIASWRDLWKQEFKGKVLIGDITTTLGVYFLAYLSRINGGNERTHIGQAFDELRLHKDSVYKFFTNIDEAGKLLATGEAYLWVTAWDRAYVLMRQGAPVKAVIPMEGSAMWRSTLSIPRGAKNRVLAQQYINFVLAPERQKLHAEGVGIFPTNKNTVLDPQYAALLPTVKEIEAGKLQSLDWDAVNKFRAQWTERWNREITR